MARVFSNYGFDYRFINMNILVSNQTDFEFYDNEFAVYNGRTYEDVAVFEYYDGGYIYAFFGGRDVKFNSNFTDVLSGTATGFLEQVWDGSRWLPIWGVEGFSYSASKLADAILTPSTSDDFAIISSVLSGNDTIIMSPSADVMRGYSGNDTIIGRGGNDTLYGDSGNDSIRGMGGADTLFGGSGRDIFVFNTTLSKGNVDVIRGFSHADDIIRLDDDIFTALRTGTQHSLAASQYKENNTGKATDSSDRIIYNKSTGDVYYDKDGNGPGTATKFAVIAGSPDAVDHTDFLIIT